MLKFKILILIVFCYSTMLFSQNTNTKKHIYKVWISKIDNSKVIKGSLYQVNDTSLKFVSKKGQVNSLETNLIKSIKIRRKGKIGKGILFGALSGFAVGGISGLISGDDPDKPYTVDFGSFGSIDGINKGTSAGAKAIINGTIGALGGGGVGAIIATKKDEFIINGDLETYKKHLDKLKSYAMIKN